MTNLNFVNSRKAVTFLFAMMLLLSAAISQDFRSSAQEAERIFDVRKMASSSLLPSANTVEAPAAPLLVITPITWGVVGLDSNKVTDGPNVFPVGARVCNNGSTAATNVVSTFVWESLNPLIDFRAGSSSSLSLATLAAGICTDFYYEIEVVRSTTVYNTTRPFHITATADTLGVISTPTAREIFVEKLVSQNRNSVIGIKLNGVPVAFGGTMNMVVGGTYTIELTASTATNGYEQIESFINLPNVIFQTLKVESTYSAPTGFVGNKLYEDGCGWVSDSTNINYRSCLGTGKTGGDVTLKYTVKVLSTGGVGTTDTTLNTLIYDFSGSSYHYNDDFSTKPVIARISLAPSAADVSVQGRAMLQAGYGIRNVSVTLTEQDGTQHYATTGSFGYFRFDDLRAGQTVVIGVAAKRYTFSEPDRVVSLQDNLTDFNFIADE